MNLLRRIPGMRYMLPVLPPAGPVVCVITLNGVISRPSTNPLQDRGAFHMDKVRRWADAAFAVPNVQAVALDINCPGACHVTCWCVATGVLSKLMTSICPKGHQHGCLPGRASQVFLHTSGSASPLCLFVWAFCCSCS
jgi:hypothetical protein